MSAGSHHCDRGRVMRPAPRTAPGRMSRKAFCGLLLGLGESLVPNDQLQGRPVSYPKLTSPSVTQTCS